MGTLGKVYIHPRVINEYNSEDVDRLFKKDEESGIDCTEQKKIVLGNIARMNELIEEIANTPQPINDPREKVYHVRKRVIIKTEHISKR